MKYEHEITFNDDSVHNSTSKTNYLSDEDKEFLLDLGVDYTTIKEINTYEINSQ